MEKDICKNLKVQCVGLRSSDSTARLQTPSSRVPLILP